MNTIILIQLIAAHLTGDFLLQSDQMCADKFSKDSWVKYKALTVHAMIQAALAYVFVAQWNCWMIPVVIGVCHFIIDWTKTISRKKDLMSFLWDQLAHFCVIIGLWWFTFARTPQHDTVNEVFSTNFWLIATAYIAILAPTSILIKSFIEYEKWLPSDAASTIMSTPEICLSYTMNHRLKTSLPTYMIGTEIWA